MPAGAKLATAYYEVIAATPGAEQQITKGLVPAADAAGAKAGAAAGKGLAKGVGDSAGAAGEAAGRSFSSRVGGAVRGMASQVAGAAKVVFGAATAAAGAAAAGILSYVPAAIEASDATDKFKSTLDFAGKSSEIDKLVASTQSYADKTVYDLSDIQNITAQLAANGVDGYDRLAEAAGNLNAVAGGSKETFASVGMVLTQTASNGKLTTENWLQLADAIPGAAGRLKEALLNADAYTGNFSEAMTKGEISAEEFNKAILDLGFEDAAIQAAQSTTTFEGAWGNLEAAITGGIVKIMEPFKGPLTSAISGLGDTVAGVADRIAAAMSGLGDGSAFSSVANGAAGLGDALSGVGPVAGALLGSLGGLASNLPVIGGAFSGLTGPAGAIIGFFAQMVANSAPLREELGGAFTTIGNALTGLGPVIQQIMGVFGQLAGQLGDTLAPVIAAVADIFAQVLAAVLPTLGPIVQNLGGAFSALVAAIQPIIAAILPVLMQAIQSLMPVLTKIGIVIAQLAAALGPIISLIGGALLGAIQAILPAVQPVVDTVVQIVSAAVDVIGSAIQIVVGVLTGDWAGAWEGAKSLVSNAVNLVISIVTGLGRTVVSLIGALVGGVIGLFGGLPGKVGSLARSAASFVVNAFVSLPGKIKGFAQSVMTGAVEKFTSLVNWVKGLPGKIVSALGNLGSLLLNAGRQIISGFLNGLKQKFNDVKNFVGGIGSWIANHKGPKAYDLALLVPNGGWIMQGLATGLRRGMPMIQSELERVVGDIEAGVRPSVSLQAQGVATTAAAATPPGIGGGETNITINQHYPRAQADWETRDAAAEGVRLAMLA